MDLTRTLARRAGLLYVLAYPLFIAGAGYVLNSLILHRIDATRYAVVTLASLVVLFELVTR
jgi:hypothetical protein